MQASVSYRDPDGALTDTEVEELNRMMTKIMKSKGSGSGGFTKLDVLREQHMARLQVFDRHYKWKAVNDYSVDKVLIPGEGIQLTPYNTVDIRALAETPGHAFKDKYLLCRTVAPPLKMFAVHLVVQDINVKIKRIYTYK
jgi:hypothetical protein